jgi:hypothetical protein
MDNPSVPSIQSFSTLSASSIGILSERTIYNIAFGRLRQGTKAPEGTKSSQIDQAQLQGTKK